jgi:hypothetical protein
MDEQGVTITIPVLVIFGKGVLPAMEWCLGIKPSSGQLTPDMVPEAKSAKMVCPEC